MADVHLRQVAQENWRECLQLQVATSPVTLVATNAQSLAEAKVNAQRVPLAIYDGAARGHERPAVPMLGFTMYELVAGVGFNLRPMIDQRFQRRGHSRAAMLAVIRRLRLYPEVEMIATSHRRENVAAAQLHRSLGFVPWEVAWARPDVPEVFLCLAG
jgi:diamine N-acetyltransferase